MAGLVPYVKLSSHQRSFNHDAISSHPTCFGASADGRSKGSCDEVDWRPGRFATAARSLGGYARHTQKSTYSFVTIRKLLTRCRVRPRPRMRQTNGSL
jgi:hypothetical protein